MTAGCDPLESAAPEHGGSGFRHGAICYHTPAELLDTLGPLVSGAVERDEPVSVVLDPPTWDGLRDRLGAAADAVVRADHDAVHSWSGQTSADRLAEQLRALTADGRRLTMVGQHNAAFDGAGGAYWSEVDVALNLALDGVPVTMLCPYPIEELRPEIAAAVRWNHAELLLGAEAAPNPAFRPPAEVLAAVPAAPAPPLGPAIDEVPFHPGGLRGMRAAVRHHAGRAGLGTDRADALVLAISELVSNSIEHGAGHGSVSWWTQPARVIAEVHDPGMLSDALPGLCPPEPTGERGRGVFLARRLCDLVHLWTGPDGTRVRVETGR